MKKIIPFKKQMIFKTNVSEITSIALENTLHCNDQTVEGDLIINGTYKITDTSIQVDEFEFKIPINIEIDNKYITDNIHIDINDFYYEIINNNILEVNIEILLDNILEREIEEIVKDKKEEEMNNYQEQKQENRIIEIEENTETKQEIKNNKKEERCIEEETEKIEEKNQEENIPIQNIFDNYSNDNEEYSTYYIYIVREGDTLDTIMAKYNITREAISEYNDLNELKLGDKIIIPEQNVRN